jgi:hypothetical protein
VENPSPGRRHPAVVSAEDLSFSARKQCQLLYLITRQLAETQFVLADQARTKRLWQEAAALELDPDRIIHLLYGVANHADLQEMESVDRPYRQSMAARRRSWWTPSLVALTRKAGAAWHRTAPPASSPAHP